MCYGGFAYFVFCKQKTAYGLRISDWSSDVCSSDLDWPVAVDHQPVHYPRFGVISDRIVERRALVPERYRVDRPFEANLEEGSLDVLIEKGKDRLALLRRQFVDVRGVIGRDEQALARGLGGDSHDRMSRSEARSVGKEC